MNPTSNQYFQSNVGDVYEQTYQAYSLAYTNPVIQALDTITSKTVGAYGVAYAYSGVTPFFGTYGGFLGFSSLSGVINTNDSLHLVNDSKMPEETHSTFCTFYRPYDSSYCMVSPLYETGWIHGEDGSELVYKLGLGETDNLWISDDPYYMETKLAFFNRSGALCGNYVTTGVPQVTAIGNIATLFPNPAVNEITVSSGELIEQLVISNIIGQKLVDQQPGSRIANLDISELKPGIYFVQVNGGAVQNFVKE